MEIVHLLVVDPQNDFCDPKGSLFVPGANEDMQRLAALIDRYGQAIQAIHVTMDTHQRMDIAHPLWWQDAQGCAPQSFTTITAAAMRRGDWRASVPAFHARTQAYLDELEAKGRYPHTIWPEHCLVGHWGHGIFPVLAQALDRWQAQRRLLNVVLKGLNPWTEHFSAIAAEVPDPADESTQCHQALLRHLASADKILVAGEASTHCVISTVKDLAAYAAKMIWLSDATSPVPAVSESFVQHELQALGIRRMTCADLML